MSYQCPVCFFDQMLDPPEDFNICPSCGTEFGNDDFDYSHAELRSRWIAKGMPWFSAYNHAPPNWSAVDQLARAEQLVQYDPQTQVASLSSASFETNEYYWFVDIHTSQVNTSYA